MTTAERARLVKAVDAWWTVVIIDPVAVPLTRLIASRTRISPTGVTLVAAALGAASIVAFFQNWLVAGAVLFQLRFLLDCVDGKLARLTGTSSERGALLDIASDVVTTAFMLTALGFAAGNTTLGLVASSVYLLQYWTWEKRRTGVSDDTKVVQADRVDDLRGVRGWLARRRLALSPRSVDVENVLFSVVPLSFSAVIMTAGIVVAAAFYGLGAVRNLVTLYRRLET